MSDGGFRVAVTLSKQQVALVVRLCRSGMFGGSDPTIATVCEELLREKLRDVEMERRRGRKATYLGELVRAGAR